MNDVTLVELSRTEARLGLLGRKAREGVLARLSGLHVGRLQVREGGVAMAFGPGGGLAASIRVHDPSFYADVALGGSVGAAEAYMRGAWSTDDLTALLRLMIRNLAILDDMEGGLARVSAPLRRAAHWLRRNSRAGSRRNIAAHYDLGNEFFRLMLDETWMYSCAVFERPGMTLREAQEAKLDRICRRLALGPRDHLLEIGTGWGGFALHAAGRYGCRVTTTTISPSQFELARERVRDAGLAGRVTLLLEDYRDLDGRFDKLVSIEMIEAIGHSQYGEFFRRAAERLVPGGRMLLQTITIADHRYEHARDEVDFIKRYVFPGATIPAVSALASAMAGSSDLRILALEDIGPHYATTLARWRANFLAKLGQVRAQGFPDTFIRLWEYYLCYCEAGFAEGQLGDAQILFERSG